MRARILPPVHVYSWSMSTHVSRLEVNYENPDDAKKCVNELHGMDTWLISLKWRPIEGTQQTFQEDLQYLFLLESSEIIEQIGLIWYVINNIN